MFKRNRGDGLEYNVVGIGLRFPGPTPIPTVPTCGKRSGFQIEEEVSITVVPLTGRNPYRVGRGARECRRARRRWTIVFSRDVVCWWMVPTRSDVTPITTRVFQSIVTGIARKPEYRYRDRRRDRRSGATV